MFSSAVADLLLALQLITNGLVLVVASAGKGDQPEDHMTKEERPELYAAKVTHAVVRTRPFGNWRKNMECYATPDWC
ncbi:unnamed protein product [Gadus morhua 'NCC']